MPIHVGYRAIDQPRLGGVGLADLVRLVELVRECWEAAAEAAERAGAGEGHPRH